MIARRKRKPAMLGDERTKNENEKENENDQDRTREAARLGNGKTETLRYRAAMDKLRWGILSTGHIAGVFARGVAASQTGELVAVASREPAAAGRFAREFGAARAHGSYESLLADPGVQAVYVATPHPLHAEWAMRAAHAGKHILCEKPLTVNRASAERVVAEARAAGVLLMEAFMYRCHPQTARVVELVRAGGIGRVGLVQATFSFNRGFEAGHRLWSRRLGGGGILDVGCYPVSFARLVAGAVDGAPFADPVQCRRHRPHPSGGAHRRLCGGHVDVFERHDRAGGLRRRPRAGQLRPDLWLGRLDPCSRAVGALQGRRRGQAQRAPAGVGCRRRGRGPGGAALRRWRPTHSPRRSRRACARCRR